MRKIITSSAVAIALAFAGVSAGAHAEDAKPAAAAPSEIPAGKLALLKRLDKAMDFDALMKNMYASMTPAMMQSMRQANPKITEQQAQDLTEVMTSVTLKYTPRMKDEMFKAYAEVFTEDELKSMVVFYESPNGQAILKKMPQVMQTFMPAVSKIMPDMMKDIQKGLCDKGLCSPAAAQ